jgi:hypothetical protein
MVGKVRVSVHRINLGSLKIKKEIYRKREKKGRLSIR